jgi:hypothetical protein
MRVHGTLSRVVASSSTTAPTTMEFGQRWTAVVKSLNSEYSGKTIRSGIEVPTSDVF